MWLLRFFTYLQVIIYVMNIASYYFAIGLYTDIKTRMSFYIDITSRFLTPMVTKNVSSTTFADR